MASRQRADALSTYRAKRHFDRTPEPRGRKAPRGGRLYTIQKHAARRLHYDLRLELDGVLKSWAVTRGPSADPADKRLAVRTEDHPVDYATFEGRIPEGNYGAGTVLLWDRGTWEPIGDPHEGLERGKLVFRLHGERLKGRWALVRFRGGKAERRENWLLIKEKDEAVDRDADVTAEHTASVASGRDMEDIAAAPEAIWAGEDADAGDKKKRAPRRAGRRSGKRTPLPAFSAPALATLVDDVPSGGDWLFEMKFDGYRAIAAASGGTVRIYTRNGLDWTARYPSIARALAALDLPGTLIDGEIVALDDKGRSNFGALQQALKTGGRGLAYFAFDLLEDSGQDLRRRPLQDRKGQLQALLGKAGRAGPVFYTDHVEGNGRAMLDQLCKGGFEGVVAKRAGAPYRAGRNRSWLKIKCDRTQEFVVVGWSPSTRNRAFSSLLLGLHENGTLRYAGKIGSGFSESDLANLPRLFRPAARPPVAGPLPREVTRGARWVRPALVAEVAFAGFTADGLVRHGRFLGLREDKPPQAVVRETPKAVEEVEDPPATGETATVGGVRLTHPEKVLYPQQGITKRDLASYLAAVTDRMLPHVARRLVSLVRCPEGRAKKCFFQRHAGSGLPDPFKSLPVREKSGKGKEYVYLEDTAGLLSAAQIGVLELHIWGSRIDKVDHPDRIVFDLDPDPSVAFVAVRRAALRLRDTLDALDLQSFPLITGGKGVHVVVPVAPRHGWPVVKAFAGALARRIAEDQPDRYVATMTKAKRKGRIFIDYFRNDHAATAIAPYSVRARPGAPVAWPVGWDELAQVPSADHVTIATAAERLRGPDPWKGYDDVRQIVKAAALRALGV